MKHLLLILATMAAMLFAACAADRPEQEAGSNGMPGSWSTDPIGFGVSDSAGSDTLAPPPMLTRAPQNEATLTTVQTSGFGVFAARTGAHKYANSSISSNFMSNEKIYYQGSSWRYDLTKYWPNGDDGANEYISFFAYAPYSDGSSITGVTDFSLPIELGDPWLVFKLPPDPIDDQIDLLYAAKVDQQKTTNGGTVNFTFKHALACVGDKITTAVSEELGTLLQSEISASLTKIEVILRQITIDYTLTQKGRLTLGSKARWQPVMSEEPTITRTVTIDHTASPVTLATITSGGVSSHDLLELDNGVFYIPVQAGDNVQKATITIDYNIIRTFSDASTTNYEGNTISTIGLQAAGGEEAGKHLNLKLKLSENIRVKPKDFTGFSILPINDVIYSVVALEPVIVVTNGYQILVKDVDYTVSYTNNVNVGTGTVTIHGMGDYDTDATLSANFNINPRDISGFTVTGINDVVYNGSEQTVTPVVKYGETTLTAGEDYTITGTSATDAGQYTVIILGQGNYTGTIARQWRITQKPLTITANAQTVTYGTAITQGTNQVTTNSLCAGHSLSAITLTQSTTDATTNGTITPSDATIKDGSNNVVTSNYNITYSTGTLTINKAAPTYTAPANANPTYNRSAQEYITTGSTSHGTIQYSTNGSNWSTTRPTATNAGSYTCYYRLVGDANHADIPSTSVACTIAPKNISGFTMTTTNPTYNNGNTVTSTITLKDGSYTLTAGTDYTVSGNTTTASNNNQPRTATCTGKGNYTGTKEATWRCLKANQNPSMSINGELPRLTANVTNYHGTIKWYIVEGNNVTDTGHTDTPILLTVQESTLIATHLVKLRAVCSGDANWNSASVEK